MNLFGLSPGELLLIMMVAMVVLGPEKLPEVAASLGKWIREFRRATEELTAQFAGDNPLYEIQRALSLTDDPVPVTPVEEPVPAYAPPELPASGAASLPESGGRVQSDYFNFPQTYQTISDGWTHGSLPNGVHRNGHLTSDEFRPIAEEWTFGVPVLSAPVETPLATVVAEPTAAGELAAALPTEPEIEQTSEPAPGEADAPTAESLPETTVSESGEAAEGERDPGDENLPERYVDVDVSEPEATSQNGTAPVPVPAAAGDGREGDRT